MELFEVGGSNAVLLYLGGKSTLALGLQRKQQQQHRIGTCDSHEKTADLGHVRDQHLMLNANCPGFQHTQQKTPKTRGKTQHGFGWRVQICADIKENASEGKPWRRENGRKIPI